MGFRWFGVVVAIGFTACAVVEGQVASTAVIPLAPLAAVQRFPLVRDGLVIRRHVEAGQPFTVAGPSGVVLGRQDGTFEAWILPVKLLSQFTIEAEVEGYTVPINVNAAAAEIEVRPDHTTITYSHIAFTVRQTMFAPESTAYGAANGTGAVVLFEIDAVRPMDLTFRFTPEMRPMWPQPGKGTPSAEWVKEPVPGPGRPADGTTTPGVGGSGFYVLHTDYPDFAGAVSIPGAQPGVLAPYQERPQVHPVELKLHFDPQRDAGKYFPLLMAVGESAATASTAALEMQLSRLNAALPQTYAAHAAKYAGMEQELTSIHTPDAGFDEDFRWAEVSIEQLRARSTADRNAGDGNAPGGEMGLVAGYYSSGDSARPGFGWYFGRDTLYTLYAVDGMGDFALTRDALGFLMKRQRADGKMMHEYSQTADFVDWKAFPYMYAAADATPLFLLAMLDYVQASGDVGFLKAHRDVVEKAWTFETTHDSDGDGIYDNVQGTAWVESWPGGLPHQEIYLALLDRQASSAMARIAALLGDDVTAKSADERASAIAAKIESEYYEPASKSYAFSRNADGSLDSAATIYPALAWWSTKVKGGGAAGAGLAHAEESFRRWDSHDFSTDWGARDVAESDHVYDPMSYHQGSVWPLFTGWASVADYRGGHALSGYAHLMQTADLTGAQDLGAVTELLSGAFFEPFGRSTSHQLWSSAMVITPALRGLFGIDVDAGSHSVYLHPHLPADWGTVEVRQLHVGDSSCTLEYARDGGKLTVRLHAVSGPPPRMESDVAGARVSGDMAVFPLPAVEVAIGHGLPMRGSRTIQMKVLNESLGADSLTLEVEGWGGSVAEIGVRVNRPKVNLKVDGAVLGEMRGDGLRGVTVNFPSGEGYQKRTVVFRW